MIYTTEIRAIDNDSKQLMTFRGINIELPYSRIKEAQRWCNENGFGYLKITGYLALDIKCKERFAYN